MRKENNMALLGSAVKILAFCFIVYGFVEGVGSFMK